MTMTFYDYVSLVETVGKREETATGNTKDGMIVDCRPDLADPQVFQRQSRIVCLTKPYPACYSCQHASFDLLFDANKEQLVDQVSCPRWGSADGRISGKPPDGYVSVETATCSKMPFEFCPSCPSRKNVAAAGADKSSQGWYGRWSRIREANRGEDG